MTLTTTPQRNTSKGHGIKAGEPTLITFYNGNDERPQGTGRLAYVRTDRTGVEIVDAETRARLDARGVAGKFWAAAVSDEARQAMQDKKWAEATGMATWVGIISDGRVSPEAIHGAAMAAEGDLDAPGPTTAEWARRAVEYVISTAHDQALTIERARHIIHLGTFNESCASVGCPGCPERKPTVAAKRTPTATTKEIQMSKTIADRMADASMADHGLPYSLVCDAFDLLNARGAKTSKGYFDRALADMLDHYETDPAGYQFNPAAIDERPKTPADAGSVPVEFLEEEYGYNA